jgi:hypothetical protein
MNLPKESPSQLKLPEEGNMKRNHLSPTETKSLVEFLLQGKEKGSERLSHGWSAKAAAHFNIHIRTVQRLWSKACSNHSKCHQYIIFSNQMLRKYDDNTFRVHLQCLFHCWRRRPGYPNPHLCWSKTHSSSTHYPVVKKY